MKIYYDEIIPDLDIKVLELMFMKFDNFFTKLVKNIKDINYTKYK